MFDGYDLLIDIRVQIGSRGTKQIYPHALSTNMGPVILPKPACSLGVTLPAWTPGTPTLTAARLILQQKRLSSRSNNTYPHVRVTELSMHLARPVSLL